MRGYDREEVEDYDDYDMEGEYQDEDVLEEDGDGYEEEEEEEEEEETRQPTQEEVEYLELRQRLKESIRRKRKHGAVGSSQEKKLPYNNFGSFFGPSQPVIAQRVIQESKSLLENQNLVSKMLTSSQSSKKNSASDGARPRQGQHIRPPKPTSELRKKVEKLKVARDYSFLEDDRGVPAPAKGPPPRNVSAPTSEARSAQMFPKSKQALSSNSNSGRNSQGIRDERKSIPLKGQLQSKAGTLKSSTSKPNGMSMDSRKQHGVSNGMGPGRPGGASNGMGPGRPGGASNMGPGRPGGASNGTGSSRPGGVSNGTGPGRPGGANSGSVPGRAGAASNGAGSGRPVGASNGAGSGRPAGPKAVPSKMPIAKMEKKIPPPTSRNLPSSAHKAPPSKMHSSDSRQHLEQKRGLQERSKDKMMHQRPPVSSKPQVNKPIKPVSSQSHMKPNVQRPKKKQLSEDEKALMMIRNMFHTDRYPVCDDDDVSDMEANWDEIMKEERRSAKIARQEDEEQLRLIEEEERRERMRRMAKKRKL
ncbi:protein SPT2-like protein [Gossypium australe]|uniref:Protein SPT2-like protein n=1 Tax=Gossypium australe TaxID=47621 RepID=A0A5B6UHY8_9ROSI|nr:protein SPT2-like protein [Gossypium australe]